MIHYHGLPMTPVGAMVLSMSRRHAMVSFEHRQQLPEATEVCQSVALDNGAFSAWRQGKPYNFEGYYEWCGQWLKHPAVDWAVIPDVIDGDEEANERLLCEWPHGKLGVPVWHLHECLERLEKLCKQWPRVAFGSSGKYADPGTKPWWGRMAQAMRVSTDKDGMPITKFHGLRMLDPDYFSHIPFSSADSCNVSRNIGYDSRWNGTYVPASKATKALVIMERVELHAAAHRWNSQTAGVQENWELLG